MVVIPSLTLLTTLMTSSVKGKASTQEVLRADMLMSLATKF